LKFLSRLARRVAICHPATEQRAPSPQWVKIPRQVGTKIESTVRYLGVEVDDALAISE
jgi:hypothetical protein